MPKTKKYSLPYWVKKCMNAWTPEKEILAAVQEFVQNGAHSQIEFTGTPLEFAHALYLERFKRGTPWAGFFPTPAWVADKAAALLGIQADQIVLDPGCGFGALSQAVEQRGGIPIMVEYSSAIIPIAQALWGEDRIHYADFTDGFRPLNFDAVAVNPPFGKVFGHSDAALDFMTRIADLSLSGTPVAAILPRGYMRKDRPKANVEVHERYKILDEIDLPEDAFAPLTKIATTLYLLSVKEDGALVGEIQPRPIATKQLTSAAAEAFLQSVPTFDVTWPMLPDGRPRAALPDGLRERLEASPCHFLKAESADRSFYQSWRDETVVLMHPEQVGPLRNVWHAGYLDGDGQLKLFRSAIGCDAEYVCGATIFEALAALREHLMAWDIGAWVYLRPTRWTAAAVLELTDVVKASEQAVLVADDELGLPTIHHCPHPEHLGYGLFRAMTDEYAINYDAGGAMPRLSNGLGYTHMRVERGVFPFDKAKVLTTLGHWTHELAMTERALEDVDRPLQHAVSSDDLPTAYARHEYNCLMNAAETARGKEPWQMTRDEFFATQRPLSDNEPVSAQIAAATADWLDQLRETLVHIALAELKPVPEAVLADFPELTEKYRSNPPFAECAIESAEAAPVTPTPPVTKRSKRRKNQSAAHRTTVEIPPIWHKPDKFEFYLDGAIVIAEYHGADSIGFGSTGSLQYDFHGPTISTTGYHSHFANFADVQQYGDPVSAAIAIGGELAAKTAAEIRQNKKTWPVKYAGDVAVRGDDGMRRAVPISWNRFNRWWYVWLPETKTAKTIKLEDIIGEWPVPVEAPVECSAQAPEVVTATVETERVPKAPKRPKDLPANIPEVIEVDVGDRSPQWIAATIVKVTSGQQLVCHRSDGRGDLKTPIYGRDITWRMPATILSHDPESSFEERSQVPSQQRSTYELPHSRP